jgi:hypothetical protein
MTEPPAGRSEQASGTPAEKAPEAPQPPETRPRAAATRTGGEHTGETRTGGTGTRMGTHSGRTPAGRLRAGPSRRAWRRIRDAIATAVVIVAVTVAVILAVHIVFVVFEANGANGIVKAINSWADSLAWNFKDVFTPADPKAAALVNYGLAAGIYLIAGRIVAALIRRAG